MSVIVINKTEKPTTLDEFKDVSIQFSPMGSES